ncbi:hypothetical protein AAFF_G00174240 [Aldrovandia affinis]|uniref:Uncharacterized protein n=1 Tax=Aldrovandia affinis TaxID=143900 RepID=A0AAD7RLG7_9TELE|nr:hypothetical protein AAFF_G00174240 [Aldrovandia affinis]
MPKIKPETKVLIIKNLKSKSPAEVADIFNVSKRQVERIHKRYQETGDVHDRPRSGRPHKTTARDDSLLVHLQPPPDLLILLDLSDTINHDILERLHSTIRLSGSALKLFQSYLSDRAEHVSLGGCKSRMHLATCCVPPSKTALPGS